MPMSIDLRKRVISAVDEGMHKDEASRVFKVCSRAIYKWLALREATGSLEPKTGYQKGHSHKITDWIAFKSFVEANKTYASPILRKKWKEITGVEMSESAMLRALKKIDYTSKKNV